MAVAIAGTAIGLLWLVTVAYLGRAAVRAAVGEFSALPGWLCAPIAR